MADQGGLQLLPETRKKIEFNVPGENKFLYAGGVVIILVVIVSAGLMWQRQSLEQELAAIDSKIVDLEKQRDTKAEANILILKKQLSLINQMLSNHILWSQGLSKIGDNLQNQVQFKVLSTSMSENRITFTARTNSYAAIARQIAAFTNEPAITDTSLNSVTVMTNGNLEFSMTLNFDRNKFVKRSDLPSGNQPREASR